MTALQRGRQCAFICSFLLLACASSYEPGIQVELISRQSGELEQSTARGVVKIDELSWTSSEITLESCPSGLAQAWDWLVPAAHAHGISTPTRLAVPSIVNASEAVPLGELTPPAGRYCSVRYRVAPADDDAQGLGTAPGMLGASLRSSGELEPAAGESSSWSLQSRRSFELSRELELELSAHQLHARLSFGLDAQRFREAISVGWFEAVAREDVLIEAFRAAFQISATLGADPAEVE
jgi:hypothetical protein